MNLENCNLFDSVNKAQNDMETEERVRLKVLVEILDDVKDEFSIYGEWEINLVGEDETVDKSDWRCNEKDWRLACNMTRKMMKKMRKETLGIVES